MRAFASSFFAWRMLERNEGIKVPHGLVFSLAVVEAIGKEHGLTLQAEEHVGTPAGFDAIMISVLDSRCMLDAARHFDTWKVPFRWRDRRPAGRYPLVWAGGQGLHNPRPFAPVADLIVVGDAEDPLPVLLDLWERHGNSAGFLSHASTVPGVYVPEHHNPTEHTIVQSVASDIGVTLRNPISVNLDGTRRLEIARGCQYKCAFCSLGWRAPVRENTAAAVVTEIQRSPKRVHLQAGDAESHSGIDQIRTALREHGGSDQGWTGRLDSLFENPDQTIPGEKRYAFGVEGVSYRLRRAVGKGYLTDDRLVSDTVRFFGAIEGDGKGRAAWHMITGLPSETLIETRALVAVLQSIDREMMGRTPRNLSLHWQPFQPLPGTPMQWFGSGGGVRRAIATIEGATSRLASARVRHQAGRTDDVARICAALARSDDRGADLLEEMHRRRIRPEDAEHITGMTFGPLDPDAPLPWDFVRHAYEKSTIRRAYDVARARFAEAHV